MKRQADEEGDADPDARTPVLRFHCGDPSEVAREEREEEEKEWAAGSGAGGGR